MYTYTWAFNFFETFVRFFGFKRTSVSQTSADRFLENEKPRSSILVFYFDFR
jgi:hypothetical protein